MVVGVWAIAMMSDSVRPWRLFSAKYELCRYRAIRPRTLLGREWKWNWTGELNWRDLYDARCFSGDLATDPKYTTLATNKERFAAAIDELGMSGVVVCSLFVSLAFAIDIRDRHNETRAAIMPLCSVYYLFIRTPIVSWTELLFGDRSQGGAPQRHITISGRTKGNCEVFIARHRLSQIKSSEREFGARLAACYFGIFSARSRSSRVIRPVLKVEVFTQFNNLACFVILNFCHILKKFKQNKCCPCIINNY